MSGIIIGIGLAFAYQSTQYPLLFVLGAWCALIYANNSCVSIWRRCRLWFTAGFGFYSTSLWWVKDYLGNEYGEAIWIQYTLWPFLLAILAASFLIPPLFTHQLSSKLAFFTLPFPSRTA